MRRALQDGALIEIKAERREEPPRRHAPPAEGENMAVVRIPKADLRILQYPKDIRILEADLRILQYTEDILNLR
ncbi:MAG: hypothetical protein LBQ79_00545 [Deltaproteobacteria bacterium]|nr:hypothetical protein [Deltaproteobacteria bacterium]